jgi:hypothetical protein
MSGKKAKQQYSLKLICMAMALWLQDNKAYKELKEADLFMLPTISYLKKMKSVFQVRDGKEPNESANTRTNGSAADPRMEKQDI